MRQSSQLGSNENILFFSQAVEPNTIHAHSESNRVGVMQSDGKIVGQNPTGHFTTISAKVTIKMVKLSKISLRIYSVHLLKC